LLNQVRVSPSGSLAFTVSENASSSGVVTLGKLCRSGSAFLIVMLAVAFVAFVPL